MRRRRDGIVRTISHERLRATGIRIHRDGWVSFVMEDQEDRRWVPAHMIVAVIFHDE